MKKSNTSSRSVALLVSALLLELALLTPSAVLATTYTLVPAGSAWKYLDNGSNQGTAWRALNFDDSSWASGPAQLGYGDGDEATVVSYGLDANNKYVTTYFRQMIFVNNPSALTSLTLRILRDDGAVFYINGTEVFRSNMPSGTISYNTWASTALGAPAESTFVQTTLNPSALLAGWNMLAVEIHQANGTSTDISFDLELTASDAISVMRGPYLQMGAPNSLIVRWRTDAPTDSRVRFGTDQANLNLSASDSAVVTEHQVTLTGLNPNTQYFYSAGNAAGPLTTNSALTFYTSPVAGSSQPVRVWVLGDSGTANASAAAVRDAYYSFTGTRYTDLLLMLGDNAYENGTDSEYQAAVFDMYPQTLGQTVLWPTIGNHDTAQSSNPPADLPYFNMFSLPTQGEAGGVASGTEKYYSFDFANIHFVCLDSMSSDRSPTGAMLTWLSNDLAANTRNWLVAFWHHPPYTKGSHNSDTETELVQMRQNALPILENYGVDLVLSGHSHSYERSKLIDQQYGLSTQVSATNILDAGSGREDGDGAYLKPGVGPISHEGTVYAVAGSSGQTSGGTLNHPVMYVSLNELGSMVLDVSGDRLDAKFLNNVGAVRDYFTIVKSNAPPNQPPSVTLTAPAQGASFTAPANISLTAEAFDTDGTISKVEFYANGTLVGSDTTAPYSAVWSGVAAGTYSLTATATDNAGAMTNSTAVNVTVNPPPPPAAPGSLTATAVSSSQINLTWTDLSSDEAGFIIERTSAGSSWAEIARVGSNLTAYADVGLQPNTTYTYRVSAFSAGGSSAPSGTASAQTAQVPPSAPAGLNASAVSKSQINLSWTDTSSNEDGFKIERATGKGSFSQIAVVGVGATSYPDVGLSANTSYTYRVRAYNTAGNSGYSNTDTAKTRPR
jgi:hypothetical protein